MVAKEDCSVLPLLTAEKRNIKENIDEEIVAGVSRIIAGESRYRIPRIGDCLLLNERRSMDSRIHGGRYGTESLRRYFGRVEEVHPHVVTFRTSGGFCISEKVTDFRIGLIQYVRLKELPKQPELISYEEKKLDSFAKNFQELLLM